jgi:hypothetical protein
MAPSFSSRNSGAAFGFVGSTHGVPVEIDISPAQAEHIGLAQSGREREARELSRQVAKLKSTSEKQIIII